MKRIHILGAGGPAGVLLCRCLRDLPGVEVTGWDDAPWARLLMEVPQSRDHLSADLVIPVPDVLVREWAGMPNTFLPEAETIDRCQDKSKTARLLGDLAPHTYWVRETTGAGGRGARQEMAAQYLPGRNLSCELVYWSEDAVPLCFAKERLSYSVSHREPNVGGVGTSMVSRCIAPGILLHVADSAVRRLCKEGQPRGIFGVDFREDEWGTPRITEINAGRFLTASYVYYYRTGYNLPRLMVERCLGLERTELAPYPEGIGIVRQVDHEPWVGPLNSLDLYAGNQGGSE